MDESQFSRLPKELRLIIYEYALTTEFSIDLRAEISGSRNSRSPAVKLLIERNYHRHEHSDREQTSSVNEDSDVDSGSDSDTSDICGNALVARRYSDESSDIDSEDEPTKANLLALTSTCRQLRSEALPVFYAANGISLENDEEVHTTFPTLQMILLTHWLRQIPGAQTGLFRDVTISVPGQLYLPDKTIPSRTLAQGIYERYVELASCFSTECTKLSLDLGDCREFNPVRTWSLFTVRLVRTKFIMTPWNSLRQEVEFYVRESEGRFQKVKAKVMRWQRAGKSVERVQRSLEGSEDDARHIYRVLRHLVELVEDFKGHTK